MVRECFRDNVVIATDYPCLASFATMISPYLRQRLRPLDEVVEDRMLEELRLRHKVRDAANRKARIIQTGNIYRFGTRLVTKFGGRS